MVARSHALSRTAATPEKYLLRGSGFLYVLLALLGFSAPLILKMLVVPGDPLATATQILSARWLYIGSLLAWTSLVVIDTVLAITLYLLLEPVSRLRALLAAALRLLYAALLAAAVLNLYQAFQLLIDTRQATGLDLAHRQQLALNAIATFNTGFPFAIIIFGVHLLVLGSLFSRWQTAPAAVGILTILAGLGYIADSLASFFIPGYGGLAQAIILVPVLLGEFALTGWLLFRGFSNRQQTVALYQDLPTPGIS